MLPSADQRYRFLPKPDRRRAGKGDKDRHTMLPGAVKDALSKHLQDIARQHEEDLKRGVGRVILPDALERKYPNAGKEWGWQWVFPATSHYNDRLNRRKTQAPSSRISATKSLQGGKTQGGYL
jgi:hypothetical protein